MESIERGVLIETLERLKAIERLRLSDTTSLFALVEAFRSVGPEFRDHYDTQRKRIAMLAHEQGAPDPVDVLQTLIDRLKGVSPLPAPKSN